MKSSGKPVPVKCSSSQSPSRLLDPAKIIGCSPRGSILSVSCGHVRRAAPSAVCDGRREGRPAAPGGIGVGADVLAEAAALLLDRVEPGDGAAHRRMLVRDAACRERGQRGAGAVEVVDAPAAEPGAVVLLLGEQPAEAALDGVVVDRPRARAPRARAR